MLPGNIANQIQFSAACQCFRRLSIYNANYSPICLGDQSNYDDGLRKVMAEKSKPKVWWCH